MKRSRFWLLAVGGIVLPVALAFAAYVVSSGFGASAGVAPGLPAPTVEDNGSHSAEPGETPDPGETPGTATSPDDHGGKCSEAEHTSDPTCSSGSGSSGSSGSGDGATATPTPTETDSGSSGSGSGKPGRGDGDDRAPS